MNYYSRKKKNRSYGKTKKRAILTLKSKTPKEVERVSSIIYESLENKRERRVKKRRGQGKGITNPIIGSTRKHSYAPTINEVLVTLQSIPREKIMNCNNDRAFQFMEPLKIAIPGKIYGKTCVEYSTPEAKRFLLRQLSANKHVDPSIIVPPVQIQSNCWFNTMFVTLFISDKGRTFFHYFRELMIKSKQADGTPIPKKLADSFALLNFAVESALTGSSYAYELNTNYIIKHIFQGIPSKYHKQYPYLVGVDKASNPMRYYGSIIHYLDEHSLQFLFISTLQSDWKTRVANDVNKLSHKPHVIIFEIYDDASKILEKPTHFTVNNANYMLDSCVIRDTSKQHFCATLTCEGKEMAYDGMSFHRLVPMPWKDKHILHGDKEWGFEGSPLKWSFVQGYQLLLYYRVL